LCQFLIIFIILCTERAHTISIAPAFGGGLFGSSTPAPAPGGMFAAPAPAHVGFFGSQPPPSQQQQALSYGGYGSQQPQQANPHQAAVHAHQSASQRQEAARIEGAIYNLHSKYSPNAADPMNPALSSNHIPSSLCAFAAILYDPLPPVHRGGGGGQMSVPRPVHINDKTWTEALARNPDPDELTPVPIVGATALHTRIVQQQERADALSIHAGKLRETLMYLEKSSKSSRDDISHANAEQEALRRRLLEIMRKVEIVRCMNQPTQRAEVEAQQRLGEIMKQVSSSEWLVPVFFGGPSVVIC
jgi:nuclear pore complex protein Nup54